MMEDWWSVVLWIWCVPGIPWTYMGYGGVNSTQGCGAVMV